MDIETVLFSISRKSKSLLSRGQEEFQKTERCLRGSAQTFPPRQVPSQAPPQVDLGGLHVEWRPLTAVSFPVGLNLVPSLRVCCNNHPATTPSSPPHHATPPGDATPPRLGSTTVYPVFDRISWWSDRVLRIMFCFCPVTRVQGAGTYITVRSTSRGHFFFHGRRLVAFLRLLRLENATGCPARVAINKTEINLNFEVLR